MNDGKYTPAIMNQYTIHTLKFEVCGYIDLFTHANYRDILIDSLQFARKNKGISLHAFCIMPSYLLLLVKANLPFRLSDFIRDYKKFTHHLMMKIIQTEEEERRLWMLHQFAYYASRHNRNEDYQIWTNNSSPHIINSLDEAINSKEVIEAEPLIKKIVKDKSAYIYSSAATYLIDNQKIEIDPLILV